MKIQNISSNQLSSKGYVDKSFKDYVQTAKKNECSKILKTANEYCKQVDITKIQDITSFAENIIDKFSKYMDKLEKHTSLDISPCGISNLLKIKNPISAKDINFSTPFVFQKDKGLITEKYIRVLSMKNLFIPLKENTNMETLEMLDKIADDLKTIPQKNIDKKLLELAETNLKYYTEQGGTNMWKRMKARKAAQEIDNYALAIGAEPVNKVRVEEYIRIAKENKNYSKLLEQERKKLKENNTKIVNDILKD